MMHIALLITFIAIGVFFSAFLLVWIIQACKKASCSTRSNAVTGRWPYRRISKSIIKGPVIQPDLELGTVRTFATVEPVHAQPVIMPKSRPFIEMMAERESRNGPTPVVVLPPKARVAN